MFDSTPCGGGASIGNNVNNHGARHTIKEGHTFTDVVSLSVEPKELEGVVHLSVLSANKECEVRLPNNASSLTFTRATSQTGYTFHVDVKKDAIVSAATSVAGFDCSIDFKIDSDDAYFKTSVPESLKLTVTGAGCGIGEYLGDHLLVLDTFPSTQNPLINVSKCVCSVGYYRSEVGWCETCTGVDFGGVCSSINTKLETIRSQPHFWRNETDSAVFTQWCVQYLPFCFQSVVFKVKVD